MASPEAITLKGIEMQVEIIMERNDSIEFTGRLKRKHGAGYWVLSLHGKGEDFKSKEDAEFAVASFKERLPAGHSLTKVEFI